MSRMEPKYTIREGHPRLYLTKERLERIRERCAEKKNAQAKYYAVLKNFADKYIPGKSKVSVSDGLCLAFLYAVGKVPGFDYSVRSIDEYGMLGAAVLSQLLPPSDLDYYERYTPDFIACYDWLFPAMTPQQRKAVFNNFTAMADKMRLALGTPIGGRFRGAREMYAYYGLPFYGDGKYIHPDDKMAAAAIDQKAKDYCDFFASYHRDQYLFILETV